jgi:hypothetical protein
MPYSKAEASARVEVAGVAIPSEWIPIAIGLGCAGLVAIIVAIAIHESEKQRLMMAIAMAK